MKLRAIYLFSVAALLVAGCSSSSDSAVTTTTAAPAPSTSTAGSSTSSAGAEGGKVTDPALAPYAKRGPYQVGQIKMQLADGRRVLIWYPADADAAKSTPTENFDVASLLKPEFQAKIPAADRPPFPIDAHPGVTPDSSRAPYPVLLFSHGFGGFPEQSATITTHIASWGFVVAAPDHVERSLSGLLGNAAQGVPKLDDTEVLKQTLQLVEAQLADAASPMAGMVDSKHVAVAGHSAGAGAAYDLAATDPDISAFISYSVAVDPGTPVPKVPGMVMLGTTDGVIPPASSRAVYTGMHPPKYLVEIAGAGHLVFSDICLIGRSGGGLVAIGKRLGIPIEQFEKLGTDGCKAGDTKPEDAFPAIDDLSVAFLRSSLGIDAKPVGIDSPDIGATFTGVHVTVESTR